MPRCHASGLRVHIWPWGTPPRPRSNPKFSVASIRASPDNCLPRHRLEVPLSVGSQRERFRHSEPPVRATVLDRLGEVLGRDCLTTFQVRDSPRHLQDPVVAAGGEPEPLDGQGEELLPVGGDGAESPELAGAHARVHAGRRFREALRLNRARPEDALADRRRRFPGRVPGGLPEGGRRGGPGGGGPGPQRAREGGPWVAAPTSWKRAGKREAPAARATTTAPSSRGWRRLSSTCWENSGISSRKSTPE